MSEESDKYDFMDNDYYDYMNAMEISDMQADELNERIQELESENRRLHEENLKLQIQAQKPGMPEAVTDEQISEIADNWLSETNELKEWDDFGTGCHKGFCAGYRAALQGDK